MDYRKEVLKYAHLMEEKGYLDALEGNISILDRENNKLYITPSGRRKLFLTEDDIAVLDFDTEEQIGGSSKASSEYRLHKAALQARPDCDAVVHCHSKYLTAYAVQCKPIVIRSNTIMALVHGEIPCVPFGQPGTFEIANGIAEKLADRDACLLGNHGVVVVGKTLESAVAAHESLEKATEIDTIARSIGEPVEIPTADEYYKAGH